MSPKAPSLRSRGRPWSRSLLKASFPLPTGDGLGGVTVQVAVGGNSAAALIVYVSGSEVGAILPSGTPLGTGTVTVNNNLDVATAPITVVASAFGAFSIDYYSGMQYAAAFTAAADGSAVLTYPSPQARAPSPARR